MNNLKFSIVIPSLNQGIFIEETLKSIINQDYKNFEIILIDGGSTDETIDIVKKYSKHIHFWVSEPDEGQAHAIAKGFAMASGDILCWLNSDDIYLPETLGKVKRAFEAFKADVVYGNKLIIDEAGKTVGARLVTPFLPKYLREAYLCGGFGIYQPSSFWTRNIYDQVGGLDLSLRFCMDNDLFNKFALSTARFCFIDFFLSGFRVHASSKSSTLNSVAEREISLLYKRFVIDRNIRFPHLKRSLARLYRVLWFVYKGRLPKVIYLRFIDRLNWLP